MTDQIDSTLDWDAASKHIEDALSAAKSIVGMPQVSVGFYLIQAEGLRARLCAGERTPELYREIMEFEI